MFNILMNKNVFFLQFLNKRKTFLKFFVVGGFCGLLDLFFLFLLTDILGLWYLYSGIISFILVSVISFLLNKNLTFKDKNENYKKQYIIYASVTFGGLIINNSFLFVFTDFFAIWYIFSRVLSSLIALGWNYTISKKFIFLNNNK